MLLVLESFLKESKAHVMPIPLKTPNLTSLYGILHFKTNHFKENGKFTDIIRHSKILTTSLPIILATFFNNYINPTA